MSGTKEAEVTESLHWIKLYHNIALQFMPSWYDIKLCIDVNSFRNKLRGVLLDKFKREE